MRSWLFRAILLSLVCLIVPRTVGATPIGAFDDRFGFDGRALADLAGNDLVTALNTDRVEAGVRVMEVIRSTLDLRLGMEWFNRDEVDNVAHPFDRGAENASRPEGGGQGNGVVDERPWDVDERPRDEVPWNGGNGGGSAPPPDGDSTSPPPSGGSTPPPNGGSQPPPNGNSTLPPVVQVPEPSAMALVGVGLAGLFFRRRR